MNAPVELDLSFCRFIRAPREKVFEAFASESGLRAWMGPRGASVAEASVDMKVGGRWRVAMQMRDGSRYAVGGNYREISSPERIVFTWKWEGDRMPPGETLVEVNFSAKNGGTEVRLRHSGFPDAGQSEAHNQGWTSTLNKLVDRTDERGSAATVLLLGDARSTYVRTARMGLAEKGVACTLQSVGPHSPEVLAVNPFGRVPAFRDGDIELFETSAILRYVEESFEGPSLLPSGILQRARCEQWVSAINAYLYDTMIRRYVLQVIFPRGPGGQPDQAVIDKTLSEIPAQLAALERAYGRGEFLAGPAVSLADLFLAPILAYLGQMPEGKRLLAAVPGVQRAHAAMSARASFSATEPPRG